MTITEAFISYLKSNELVRCLEFVPVIFLYDYLSPHKIGVSFGLEDQIVRGHHGDGTNGERLEVLKMCAQLTEKPISAYRCTKGPPPKQLTHPHMEEIVVVLGDQRCRH